MKLFRKKYAWAAFYALILTAFTVYVLLDVFVAVFVMGIALHHINKTFESIDVGRFCSLRD